MTTKRRHQPTRPFGDSIGPIEDVPEVLERLRAGFVPPTVLRRTVASLIAHLRNVSKPANGYSDAEIYSAKRTLDLLAEIYREALERKVRT